MFKLITCSAMCSLVSSTNPLLPGITAVFNGVAILSIVSGCNHCAAWKMYLIAVTVFLTSLTSHISAFYNTVLIVVRTINIMLPFYKMKNNYLKLTFLMYPLAWTAISVSEIYLKFKSVGTIVNNKDKDIQLQVMIFAPTVGSGIIKYLNSDENLISRKSSTRIMVTFFTVVIPYVIPAVICLVSFFIQAAVLLRKAGTRSKINLRITITILYLTALFFVCNTTYFLTCLLVIKNGLANVTPDLFIALHITGVSMTFLNSALNPIILVARGNEIKVFLRNMFGFPVATRSQDIIARISCGDGNLILGNGVNIVTKV